MRAPFLTAYVCFSTGILAGCALYVPPALLAAAALVALLSLRRPGSSPALAAQLLLLILLGQQYLQMHNARHATTPLISIVARSELETYRVRGIVIQTPEISPDYTVLRMRILTIADRSAPGVARVTITGTPRTLPAAGDEVEAFVRFRLPRNFATEGSFNYERYLCKEGIHALGTIKSGELLQVVRRGSSLRSFFSRIRLSLIHRLMRNYPPAASAVLRALWLDDRAGLLPDTERTLIDAGIFHVIAISGFHVAVVLSLGFLALRRLVRYKPALLILGAFLLFYFLLLEGRPAISRSFLLFLAFAFASVSHEQIRWSNALCLCAFLQAAWNPLNLFDAGYHLTYLSTAAIVFIAVPLCRRAGRLRAVYRYVLEFAVVSVCVQFVLMPYQAWTFHRVPFGALITNWAAIPASSILIALGIVVLPLPQLDSWFSPVVLFCADFHS